MTRLTFSKSPSQEPSGALTEILRNGARALSVQAVEAEVAALSACMRTSRPRSGANGWCATDICRNARS